MNQRPPGYGLQLTEVTDPDELEAVGQLAHRLRSIDELDTQWQRVARVRIKPGSEIALDDRHTAWKQLSHNVSHGLNTALDNITAFKRLVLNSDGHIVLPYSAQYPLLRTALEASSQALWLLAPDDPRERIRRLLRLSAAELFDDTALHNQMVRDVGSDVRVAKSVISKGRKDIKARSRKHLSQLRSTAAALHLPDFTEGRYSVGYGEIVREATAATGLPGYYGETIWRITSGLTHPSLMRAIAHSDLEEISDNGDGTLNGMLTSDAALTRTALEAAVLNTREAIAHFGRRKIKPGDPAQYLPREEVQP